MANRVKPNKAFWMNGYQSAETPQAPFVPLDQRKNRAGAIEVQRERGRNNGFTFKPRYKKAVDVAEIAETEE